jgi:hypothetical protein
MVKEVLLVGATAREVAALRAILYTAAAGIV